MLFEDVIAELRSVAMQPEALFLAIILATFILEDAAIVGAGVLAAEGVIHPVSALSALFIGIALGDLGLYGLGYAAAHWRWIRKRIGVERIRQGRTWLSDRLVMTILGARAVPGLRLPTYTASGFFRVPFTKFALIAIVGVGLWTAVIFTAVYWFGTMAASMLGPWSWAAGGVLLVLSIIVPRFIAKRTQEVNASPGGGAS